MDLGGRVHSVLALPVVVVMVGFLMLNFCASFVLPVFGGLFADYGSQPPLLAQSVLDRREQFKF